MNKEQERNQEAGKGSREFHDIKRNHRRTTGMALNFVFLNVNKFVQDGSMPAA